MQLHSRSPLDLHHLPRSDLEALAGLKLWEELRVSERESRPVLADVSAAWLTRFLEKGAPCIGEMLLDAKTLARARSYYAPLVEPTRRPPAPPRPIGSITRAAWRAGPHSRA